MIITDNTLWSGKILSPGLDPQTDSIRLHNEKASELKGFTKTLLPIRDGMYLIQKVCEERPEGL
jgi:predicted O-methyltransferase YrrM